MLYCFFFTNQYLVVENRFETGFLFYWPSRSVKSCNIWFLWVAIFDCLMKTFVNTQHETNV